MNDEPGQNWVKRENILQLEGVRRHAAHFTVGRDAPRHVHQDYIFGLMTEGAMEIDCGHCGKKHILEPGDLLLTEAHEVYSTRALGKPRWRYFSIGVAETTLVSLLDHFAGGNRSRLPHFKSGAVKNAKFRELFAELYRSLSDDRSALESESRLLDWVTSVYENYAENSNRSRSRRIYSESVKIRRVREYIREHVAENIKLETLAGIAGLSPFHLNRTFSAQVGLPPHEFQNQLRVESAAQLIAQKKSLAEIALETGFSDQSHFNRFFKRYTGVTPKKFIAR